MLDLDRVRMIVAERVRAAGVSAFAIGIVSDGELIYEQGFGRTVNGDDVGVDTPFPSLSSIKPLTTSAVLRLWEMGEIDIDKPVVAYLPWLRFPTGGDVATVTLRHLLSHTSGLSSDPEFPPRFFTSDPKCLEDHIRVDIPTYRAAGPPGELFWYSNPGFNIAGYLAEQVTGEPFAKLMEELVFNPCDLRSTTFDSSHRVGGSAAAMLDAAYGLGGQVPPIVYPAGGALTTVRDLARFSLTQMSGSSTYSLLEPSTVAQMQTIHADAYTQQPRHYGLGLNIEIHRGRRIVTQGGGGFGCGSTFVIAPDDELAVVALFNHSGGYSVSARELLNLFLGSQGETEDIQADDESTTVVSGKYVSSWPDYAGYPNEITITQTRTILEARLDQMTSRLQPLTESIYRTDQGYTVGFVAGGKYLMYDAYGMGLVSAWPYRRCDL